MIKFDTMSIMINTLHDPIDSTPYLQVDVNSQTLTYVSSSNQVVYTISTAKKGVGEVFGSEQTPTGWHMVRAKIGHDQPINTVFVGRRPTGEIYTPDLAAQFENRDWILTRIFWLSGLELGRNRLGPCDTMRRYVYIHGVPPERILGTPQSRGCIQMHNTDLIELFNMVPVGTKILIT